MENLKDVISDLKKARNKCVDTVDKSTLKKIDVAIEKLELEQNKEKQPSKIKWLSLAVKVLALIRLAMGDVNE